MEEPHKIKQKTVAVIGTGMAGLVTAYLLHHDPQRRYQVRLLEKRNQVSLSAESIAIPSQSETKKSSAWADVPMRAFAGGFYHNLIRMYDHLGIQYHPQSFLFSFARLAQQQQRSIEQPYMFHASNFHQIPPIPYGDLVHWVIEAVYALVCYLWFTVCCFFCETGADESFDQYLQRICLPQYYVASYLLPLISSVCTCSHQELLEFPASDVLEYKKRTHRQQHYVVTDGVYNVQEKLLQGLDVSLGVHSTQVVPTENNGVEVRYLIGEKEKQKIETFDLVVLAVSPDVVATVFEPLKTKLTSIPTTTVGTVAHSDFSTLSATLSAKSLASTMTNANTQCIQLRSNQKITESVHVQPNHLLVTTNPLTAIDPAKTIQSASFTRVLRSPLSRRVINEIFNESDDVCPSDKTKKNEGWRNGEGGVYLAGGWCWDGMVLLEGCVVSAMRVAAELGVEIPWS